MKKIYFERLVAATAKCSLSPAECEMRDVILISNSN